MVPPGTLSPPARKRSGGRGAAPDVGFQAAVRLHIAGDLSGAERAYRRVITDAPRHAPAHNNLGSILAGRGELGAALACYATAAELDANYAEAFHNFGLVLVMTELQADAVPLLERAVALDPKRAAWWSDLGNARAASHDPAGAIDAFDRALTLAPGDVAALVNRSAPLRTVGRLADAIASVEEAAQRAPASVAAWANLGLLRREQRDLSRALAALEAALALDPQHAPSAAHMAYTLLAMGRVSEARRTAEWLSGEFGHLAESWTALGAVAFEVGEYDEAEAAFNTALRITPHDAAANWNLAMLTLMRGDFREGLARFEHRKRVRLPGETVRRDLPPEWDGSPMRGARVVVLSEQGLGDQLHFARYLSALKACGASHVTVECAGAVRALLAQLPGIDAFIGEGEPLPPADLHVRLMGMALRMGTTLETVPLAAGYLRATERPVAAKVRALPGPRVGLVWAGNPNHPRDSQRSMPLSALRELLSVPGVSFVSLQKGDAVAALAEFPHVHDLAKDDVDLADTAAALAELDVVITIDSAIAHVAGATGRPVWCAISHVADWRWRVGADDTSWYASMRLLRQPERGDWASVAAVLADGVRQLVAGTPAREICPVMSHAPPHASPHTNAARATHAPSHSTDRRPVSISWQVGLTSGWGTYGLQLARHLAQSPRAEPVLAMAPELSALDDADVRLLASCARTIAPEHHARAVHLTGLGNALRGPTPVFTSRRNAAVVFLEDTAFDDATRRRARGYDLLVAGSRWNEALLRSLGHPHVSCVWQGIDPALFHPRARGTRFGDRFVVFSGGKLEFRKGQDLVVAAFRAFHQRHADALLVTAWHNHWPATMAGIESAGHVQGMPSVVRGQLDVTRWLVANGIPAAAVHDLGVQPQGAIAALLYECDVAVFPNRAEGGTNLVAMEAMAAGVPAIVAANTGQRDLLSEGGAIPLARQSAVRPAGGFRGTADWGESDVEEIVEALERSYVGRDALRVRGLAGAAHVGSWTWARQVEVLLDTVL